MSASGAPRPTPDLLQVDGVVSGYGEMEILHGVSVRVARGEVVAIIGPNGSGKSTLLKTVFGLLRAKQGRILFNGQDITGLAPHQVVRLGLCYVPQADNTFLSLTVQENLEMGGFLRRDGVRQRIEELLDLFPDLRRFRHTRVNRLSGGQRQMAAIARALMLDPQMLLLDEPSAGLSPRFVEAIFQRVAEINRQGVTILLVEQNARKALEVSQRGYVLASGENRYEGESRSLLENEEIGRLYLGR